MKDPDSDSDIDEAVKNSCALIIDTKAPSLSLPVSRGEILTEDELKDNCKRRIEYYWQLLAEDVKLAEELSKR
jgi:hypothetical protein